MTVLSIMPSTAFLRRQYATPASPLSLLQSPSGTEFYMNGGPQGNVFTMWVCLNNASSTYLLIGQHFTGANGTGTGGTALRFNATGGETLTSLYLYAFPVLVGATESFRPSILNATVGSQVIFAAVQSLGAP